MEHFDEERVLALARVPQAFAARCVDVAFKARRRGEFEHVREARIAFLVLRGHGIALDALVHLGPAMYPSGWSIARSMFEVGVRNAWRIDVEDPFEAEGRWATWLGRFVQHERHRSNALRAEGLSEWAENVAERADQAQSFHQAFVNALLEQGATSKPQEPSMRQVLKALGQPDYRYQTYADASEQLHGNFVAFEAYSRGLGSERIIAEYAEWVDWVAPLMTGMQGVQALGQVFADRLALTEMEEVIAVAENKWESALRD